MTIARDLSARVHSSVIELFELDATALGGAVHRFVPATSQAGGPVVWQGLSYAAWPVEAAGFDRGLSGPMPRPTLRVGNKGGLITGLIKGVGGLKGAKLTRRRTLGKYLDAVNFVGGNPQADPLAGWADELWNVDRSPRRDGTEVVFELRSPLDVAGTLLPRRQAVSTFCSLVYRGTDPETRCPYAGGPVATRNDVPTSNPALDQCSQKLSGCKLRFPNGASLPFGGFPGLGLVRQL